MMEAEFVLGGGPNIKNSSSSSSSPKSPEEGEDSTLPEAKAILKVMRGSRPVDKYSTCNKTLWVVLLQRLMSNDRSILEALFSQAEGPDTDNDFLFLCDTVMSMLLFSDENILNFEMSAIDAGAYASLQCHSKRLSRNDNWLLPSCQVALDLLRAFPEEDSYSIASANQTTLLAETIEWSLHRTLLYLPRNWDGHTKICSILLCLACSDQKMSSPWIDKCVQLWEQLLAAMAHPDVAYAVLWEADEELRQYAETVEVGLKMFFKPLLNVLTCLKWRHDPNHPDYPLFELALQVAALLVAQSYRLQRLAAKEPANSYEFDLHSTYLEGLFVAYLSVEQSRAWNNHYLPWAAEVAEINAEACHELEKDDD